MEILMKKTLFVHAIIGFALLAIRCADYDLADKALHPDAVTLDITAVTDSSITLRWTQSHNEDFSNYKVYYSKSDVVENTDSLSDSLTFIFDTTKTVTRLASGTTYYFRVILNTKSGGFSASNIVHATTTGSVNTGVIVLYNADSVSDSTRLLHWTKCAAAFDRYRVFADTTNQVNTLDSLVASVASDTFVLLSVKNFKPDHSYWFKVYAQRFSDTIVAASNIVQVNFGAVVAK
jgi:hypothetical protein